MGLPVHYACPAPARMPVENSFTTTEDTSHIVSELPECEFSHSSCTLNNDVANGLAVETNVNGDNVMLSTSRDVADVNVNVEDIVLSPMVVDATYEITQPTIIPTGNAESHLPVSNWSNEDDDELPHTTDESCEVPASVGQEMQQDEQQSVQADCGEQSNLQALRGSVAETDSVLPRFSVKRNW
ncbi:hypothetical protein V6N13_004545 [Hibiscus sabdariffa]|uniref:Uncharacterized protein n=1 Tax=Hibiscus sabdariffa TaxID=183260 RepID=A0ABR2RZL8_9ROSI